MNKDIYMENIFNVIANLLTKASTGKILKQAAQDPDLLKSVEDMNDKYNRLQEKLPDFCKKYPDSPACKNLNKGK